MITPLLLLLGDLDSENSGHFPSGLEKWRERRGQGWGQKCRHGVLSAGCWQPLSGVLAGVAVDTGLGRGCWLLRAELAELRRLRAQAGSLRVTGGRMLCAVPPLSP